MFAYLKNKKCIHLVTGNPLAMKDPELKVATYRIQNICDRNISFRLTIDLLTYRFIDQEICNIRLQYTAIEHNQTELENESMVKEGLSRPEEEEDDD
ncbi:hypothetical protein Hanom_Chr14g01280891 [Helianthus anomalus]